MLPRHDGAVKPAVIYSGDITFGRHLGGSADGDRLVVGIQYDPALGEDDVRIEGLVSRQAEGHWRRVSSNGTEKVRAERGRTDDALLSWCLLPC